MAEGGASFYARAYDLTGRRWRMALALVLAICLMAVAGLFTFVEYDGDVLLMLPSEENIERSINYFRSEDASGKVAISLGLGADGSTEKLLKAADDLADSLDRDIFTSAMSGPDIAGAGEGMDVLFGALPYLLTDEDLQRLVGPRLRREEVAARLKAGYLGMFRPGGVMAGKMIMEDPLGLRSIVFDKLNALSRSTGFEVLLEKGQFISVDRRHALVLASTDIEATDTLGSRKLVSSLKEALSKLPPGISADIMSGHMHTVSNEDTIKSDIRLTLAIAALGFVLLFVVFIGDLGSVLIFIVPAMAVAVAANLSYMIAGRLSYSVIGLAAVVAGISVDYGIHVYIGTRKGQGALTNQPISINEGGRTLAALNVIGMARPVTYGALTTVGMFGSFFFSRISGYHQMAVFSMISVLVSLGIALFVLPHLVSRWGHGAGRRLRRFSALEAPHPPGRWAFIIWLALTVILAVSAMGVRLNTDVRAIDGTEKAILKGEDRFFDTWGTSRLAVLVGRAETLEGALELSEELYGLAMEAAGGSRVSALASLWPSRESMRNNRASWEAFWTDEKIALTGRLLEEEGRPYGYSDNAFEPFMNSIRDHSMPDGLPGIGITERYLRPVYDKNGDARGYQASVFMPDEPAVLDAIMPIIESRHDAYLVSGRALGDMISRSVTEDMRKMTIAAALAIVILCSLFLRHVGLILAALVPVLTSTIWLAGVVALMGLRLNVATLVAFIVVMGLCVDYGIFMSHRSTRPADERMASGTVLAVTLSALSSLIGAGVLIFASHPALFSIGVTLVIGLGSGYLSSVLVVPFVAGSLMPGSSRQAGGGGRGS